MLNEPPQKRRPHPLDRRPEETPEAEPPRQKITLYFPNYQPYITIGLIVINTLVFILMFFNISRETQFLTWGAANHVEVLIQGEYHRLITAMFLHSGLQHIASNMLSLFIVGSRVEAVYGHLRFALVYFLGGLAGSILSILLNGSNVYSVGASGAVFAIFAAELVYLFRHRKLLTHYGRRRLEYVVVLAVLNLGIGIASSATPGGGIIDNWGHIGGFVGGALLAWQITPLFLYQRHPVHADAHLAVDSQPLRLTHQSVSLYTAGLLAVLIIATLANR